MVQYQNMYLISCPCTVSDQLFHALYLISCSLHCTWSAVLFTVLVICSLHSTWSAVLCTLPGHLSSALYLVSCSQHSTWSAVLCTLPGQLFSSEGPEQYIFTVAGKVTAGTQLDTCYTPSIHKIF